MDFAEGFGALKLNSDDIFGKDKLGHISLQ